MRAQRSDEGAGEGGVWSEGGVQGGEGRRPLRMRPVLAVSDARRYHKESSP
jgi:hypothetical protein